jgi:uncharacterized protein (TIGR02266 family)
MIPKILLVDDVKMFLDLQKMFLRLTSARILTAGDGLEALETARREKPSLIFMDLHMPKMGGADCCMKIKADPELKSIPVVMITSEGNADDRELCFRAGCNGFMTKPIDRLPYLEMARRFVPTVDRRDHRIPHSVRVKFRAFGLTLSGETVDISRNGLYVATDHELKAETSLELVFALLEGNEGIIQAKGRVAWFNGRNERKKRSFPVGFGIELTSITEESSRALRDFLENR